MMTTYVSNTEAVVRVDGQPVTVEPSTPLPEGVEETEIERLLRFDVISKAKPGPKPKAGEGS